MPLRPGRYTISGSLKRTNGETVDAAPQLGSFGVVPSDYFGTGVFPGEMHAAPILVRHRWNFVPQSDAGVDLSISKAV